MTKLLKTNQHSHVHYKYQYQLGRPDSNLTKSSSRKHTRQSRIDHDFIKNDRHKLHRAAGVVELLAVTPYPLDAAGAGATAFRRSFPTPSGSIATAGDGYDELTIMIRVL